MVFGWFVFIFYLQPHNYYFSRSDMIYGDVFVFWIHDMLVHDVCYHICDDICIFFNFLEIIYYLYYPLAMRSKNIEKWTLDPEEALQLGETCQSICLLLYIDVQAFVFICLWLWYITFYEVLFTFCINKNIVILPTVLRCLLVLGTLKSPYPIVFWRGMGTISLHILNVGVS